MMRNEAIAQKLYLNRVTLAIDSSVNVAQRQTQKRRMTAVLEQVDVHPMMPPQAILVVRYLADPQPEQLLAVDCWRGLRLWEQAAQNALNNCWRQAIRVARSPVPANANSVWFADQAEWLACLSWDLVLGIAGDRWWWQTILRPYRSQNKHEILYSLWRTEIQYLPATLMLLFCHHSSGLNRILDRLTTPQLEQLLTQLMQSYQYQLPTNIFTQSKSTQTLVIQKLRQLLTPSMQAVLDTLKAPQKMLVAICFNLAIAVDLQQVLRVDSDQTSFSQPSSQEDIAPQFMPQTWSEIAQDSLIVSDEITALLSDENVKSNEVSELDPTEVKLNVIDKESDFSKATTNTDFKIVEIKITPQESASTITPELIEESFDPVAPTAEIEANSPSETVTNTEPTFAEDRPVSIPFFSAITEENPTEIQGIQTSVGGLWYLVNVLVVLEWPGRSPLITPWHQLLLLAQALLPEIPPDPVWGLLTEIAGEPLPESLATQWQSETIPLISNYLNIELELPQPITHYLLEPATLYFTRTHVDVLFSLDQIQFDLRIAGLDQDPGWVPELAHVITFHYE